MEFLKKHYEKILLSLVLLALVGAVVWMQMAINKAREEMQITLGQSPAHHAAPPLDLTKEQAALDVMRNPKPVVLSGEHNLFNPVKWVKSYDGSLSKILKEGAEALVITNIHPLFTVITFDRPSSVGYYFNTQQHSGKKSSEFMKINDKDKHGLFILRSVKGPPEDPSELILELPNSVTPVSVTKDKPYEQVDGYAADMKYEPDGKTFRDQRVDALMNFAGDAYKIVAITNNAVRVQANSNQKQTTIMWNGAPDTNSATNSGAKP